MYILDKTITEREKHHDTHDTLLEDMEYSTISHLLLVLLVPPQSVEIPTKTRYQTRYSTRLAGTMINEEVTISTATNRRTTRLTSE